MLHNIIVGLFSIILVGLVFYWLYIDKIWGTKSTDYLEKFYEDMDK